MATTNATGWEPLGSWSDEEIEGIHASQITNKMYTVKSKSNVEHKKYFIQSSTFLGSSSYGYEYKIVFNKSLGHTGKFKVIEEALDNYEKSKWQMLWIAFKACLS